MTGGHGMLERQVWWILRRDWNGGCGRKVGRQWNEAMRVCAGFAVRLSDSQGLVPGFITCSNWLLGQVNPCTLALLSIYYSFLGQGSSHLPWPLLWSKSKDWISIVAVNGEEMLKKKKLKVLSLGEWKNGSTKNYEWGFKMRKINLTSCQKKCLKLCFSNLQKLGTY